MAVINGSMKKVIKGMAVTAQTAQFISLMPKPQDFVTRLVGDVVYLSAQVQKLSDDINKLLDQYAQIPSNYLMTQMNSITGSAQSIVNRVSTYTQNGINQTLGLAENTLETMSSITGTAIDAVSATSQAVTSLGMTVAHTSSAILGKEDVASDIHDASEVILEWTGEKFEQIKSDATDPLKKAEQKITNTKTAMTGKVNSVANSVNETIAKPQQWLETLLNNLKAKMDALSSKLDSGFKDVTGINSIANGASYVNEALKESDNKSSSAQITTAVSESVSKVLKNFSIAKVVFAFGGVLTESLIVKAGLNELPPIDFESMLNRIRTNDKKTNNDLYNDLNYITDSTYKDVMSFGASLSKIPSDERNYSADKYKDFIKQYNDEIKKQREEIRLSMKSRDTSKMSRKEEMEERKKLKSAIKEVRKFKKQVKNAKQSSKLIDIINDELDSLKKEVQYKCDSIKSDWNQMMKQYKDAIKEITKFFKNGGDGDKFIDDCCEAINKDCEKIKELCKNLVTQLIACTIKVAVPSDIGMVAPNPVYKIADFWMDIKTIFKFIKDLITLIIDIINNINKIARIIYNGINNLNEIIKQLMSLLGLQWFIDLIQSIIDLFGGKITDARALLQNMLSPVYYSDTEEYDNTLEALEKTISENGDSTQLLSSSYMSILENSDRYFQIDKGIIGDIRKGKLSDKKYEELLDDLDKAGDDIVAYKSPVIAEGSGNQNGDVTVTGIIDGSNNLDSDVKIIGWHFFHPNLNYKGSTYYQGGGLITKILRKIKSKIIKKASKTSNKKRGGVAMLKRKKVKKDTAYKAFYWYTYYTEDLEKDCFELTTAQDSIKIDSVIQTENGSIVELDDGRKVFVADNMVKSGDYVTVDGVKYRVK